MTLTRRIIYEVKLNFVYSVDEVYGTIFDRKLPVVVYYNGKVRYSPGGKSTTTCILDMTYFPFDSQACFIELKRLVVRICLIFSFLHLSAASLYDVNTTCSGILRITICSN